MKIKPGKETMDITDISCAVESAVFAAEEKILAEVEPPQNCSYRYRLTSAAFEELGRDLIALADDLFVSARRLEKGVEHDEVLGIEAGRHQGWAGPLDSDDSTYRGEMHYLTSIYAERMKRHADELVASCFADEWAG